MTTATATETARIYQTSVQTYNEGHAAGYQQAMRFAIGLVDGPDNRDMVSRILHRILDDRMAANRTPEPEPEPDELDMDNAVGWYPIH